VGQIIDAPDFRRAGDLTFETASALGPPAAAEAGMLYRYETANGRVVYSTSRNPESRREWIPV